MSTKLGTASFALIVNYLDVAQDATVPCRQRTGHRDSPNKASYYFYDCLSLAVDWQTIFCIPSTLFILCWRRLIAFSYRLKTISSPQNPLIPSPSGDGQWLVFYVFFMIEIFRLRGGLPRNDSQISFFWLNLLWCFLLLILFSSKFTREYCCWLEFEFQRYNIRLMKLLHGIWLHMILFVTQNENN